MTLAFALELRPHSVSVEHLDELIQHFESGATGEIVKTQTTYLDLVCSTPAESTSSLEYRVHLRGKREFALGLGQFTSLELFEDHPLLLEYTDPIVAVQLASAVDNRNAFHDELEKAAATIFGGWRPYDHYSFMPLDQFLDTKFGILMEAPKSYADEIVKAGERCGVKLTTLDRYQPKGIFPRVLLLDSNYVVADNFDADPNPPGN